MAESVQFRVNDERFIGRLAAFVQRVTADLDTAALQVTVDVGASIVQGWPVDTGLSRAAWFGPQKLGIGHYRWSNPTPYAGVIEYGGYRGVGPRTAAQPAQTFGDGIQVATGIFPTQKPHAPVRRALAAHQSDFDAKAQAVLVRHWGR